MATFAQRSAVIDAQIIVVILGGDKVESGWASMCPVTAG